MPKPPSIANARARRTQARRKNARPLTEAVSDQDVLSGEVLPPPASIDGRPVKAPWGRERGESYQYNDATYPDQARVVCRLGGTDAALADLFGVSIATIYNWRAYYAKFNKAMEVGKGEFDEEVKRALSMRAVGYTYDAVRIFLVEKTVVETKDGVSVETTTKEPLIVAYREHVPPDVAAASLWLRNRRPEEWRDTQDRRPGSMTVTITMEEAQL